MLDVITNARSLRQLLGYTREMRSDLIVETDDSTLIEILRDQEPLLTKLASISAIKFRAPVSPSSTADTGAKADLSAGNNKEAVRPVSESCRVFMRTPDANQEQEIAKSEKLLAQIRARRETLLAQVNGATYATRVPQEVQAKNSKKLALMEEEIATLEKTIASLRKQ